MKTYLTGKSLFVTAIILSVLSVAALSKTEFFTQNKDAGDALVLKDASTGTLLSKATYKVAMPEKGNIRDLDHGNETAFMMGALAGTTEDLPANGVVQLHAYEDGAVKLSVRLHIEPAKEGTRYEAYLTGESQPDAYLGKMKQSFGDVRHFLEFQSNDDLSEYRTVVIKVQPDSMGRIDSTFVVATAELSSRKR